MVAFAVDIDFDPVDSAFPFVAGEHVRNLHERCSGKFITRRVITVTTRSGGD